MAITQHRTLSAALAIAALSIAADTAQPENPSFAPAERAQLACVAALAIAAYAQQTGGGEGEGLPRLVARGAAFAEAVGARVMTTSRQSRETVRDGILAEVAALQARARDNDDPASVAQNAARSCLPMLDTLVPPAPPPPLPMCAAALSAAADDARAREGLSKGAKDLITFATVLDARAREELRFQGKSGSQADAIMGAARAELLAQAGTKTAPPIDLADCLERAKPDR